MARTCEAPDCDGSMEGRHRDARFCCEGCRVKHGYRYEDPPLTVAQLHYLEAFDRFLLAGTMGERIQARESMGVRLNYVLAEAGLGLPTDTRWADRRAA